MNRRPKASGADHTVMRELNRSLVLDVIKQHSPMSRAAIAKATSLAKPTVSAIIDDLLAEGLVREIGVAAPTPGGGRPPMLLEFNARSQYILGIQVGVRRTTVVVADALGNELERVELPTPRGNAVSALKKMAAAGMNVLTTAGASRDTLAAVGVCMPGLVDLHSGICLLAPNLAWRNVPVSRTLGDELGVPVYVVNTVDAAIVVEHVQGAAQGVPDVILLYVGRGIGASIITDGRLLHGSAGLAGEIGHCHVPGATEHCNCGKVGCLEAVADGPAIARTAVRELRSGRASTLSPMADELRPEDVADAAAQGDELALEVLARSGREVGVAASWLINLFNPQLLLIGGGVAGAGEPFLGPLREAAMEMALPQAAERVRIEPWSMGRDASVRGAVLVALQYSESYYRVIFQG